MKNARDKSNEELVQMGIAPVSRSRWATEPPEVVLPITTSKPSAPDPAKLSNRQRKKARKEKAAAAVCFNFTQARCEFGAGCRFSHDMEAFFAQRRKDLPGKCPFAEQDECPYGVLCRWALSHSKPDSLTKALSDCQAAAAAKQSPENDEEQRAGNEGEPPAAGGDASALNGKPGKRSLAEPEAGGEQEASPSGDGSLPDEVLALPTLPKEAPTANALDKDVQQQLRRRAFDFSKADKLVAEVGGKPAPDSAAAAKEPPAAAISTGTANGVEGGSPAPLKHSQGDAQLMADEPARLFDVRQQGGADAATMDVPTPLRPEEKRRLDLRGKLYLAPLTTVGNLPFRRVCKGLGVDITCGEMALATCLLQGQASEWALMKRHPCEDLFGVQVCGSHANSMIRCAQLLEETVDVDFVDINMGCPIDLICSKGAGSALMQKPLRMEQIVRGMSRTLTCPLTIKVRRGYLDGADVAHLYLPRAAAWGAAAATLHGRSREQRYTKFADWEYIGKCAEAADPLPLIGNGDIFSFCDYERHMQECPQLATTMLARGALIKPWLFTEIKERRHWDISASERLELLKQFCSAGLLHWGSDEKGVETTRRFLLEWLSFLCRYIPVGVLEVVPQQLHWRPPLFCGRSDLETLFASQRPSDWVAISEMLLGPPPPGFVFTPKHKSNSYTATESSMSFEDQENG